MGSPIYSYDCRWMKDRIRLDHFPPIREVGVPSRTPTSTFPQLPHVTDGPILCAHQGGMVAAGTQLDSRRHKKPSPGVRGHISFEPEARAERLARALIWVAWPLVRSHRMQLAYPPVSGNTNQQRQTPDPRIKPLTAGSNLVVFPSMLLRFTDHRKYD